MGTSGRVAAAWRPRPGSRAAIAVGLVCAGYVAWLVAGPSRFVVMRDDWLYCVAEGAGAAYAVGCAVTSRRVWLAATAVAVGLLLTTIGDIVSDAWIHDASPPGLPDLFWLTTYPALYLGLVARTGKRLARLPLSVRLDGLLAGLAAAALGSLAIRPIADAASGHFAQIAVNLAYPVGDTLLVALTVAVLALLGSRLWDCGRWRWVSPCSPSRTPGTSCASSPAATTRAPCSTPGGRSASAWWRSPCEHPPRGAPSPGRSATGPCSPCRCSSASRWSASSSPAAPGTSLRTRSCSRLRRWRQ